MAISTNKPNSKVKSPHSATNWLEKFSLNNRISDRDRNFFTEQMALLLETGSSMQASLDALKKQLIKPAMIKLVQALSDDVGQGKQFSEALARHPQVFSTTYVNLIAASEVGGFMHDVMNQLLALDERRAQLRQTMSSALSYPIFLMVFALAVVIFVLVVVFPKFADLFAQIKDELPVTTVFLMAASAYIKQYWIVNLVAIGGLFVAFKLWANTSTGKKNLDWTRLHMPFVGKIYTELYLVQAFSVLGLSLTNGVGMMDSLKASKNVVDNRLFQQFISNVEEQVRNGNGIAVGFNNVSFIPPIVEQMIHTGEETGSLPKVLNRLSGYFENELSNKLKMLSRFAEPVMLLIMGGVVGLIVSSLILPIFKLSRAVG